MGDRSNVAGRNEVRKGFKICKDCGKIQTEENIKENNKLEESKKDFSKKKGYLNYDQRDYSNFDWDSLYANLRK